MSDHRCRPEVELLSVPDTGRCRRWTDAEKVRIVEESFDGLVAETARRHGVGQSSLVRWRCQYREGQLTRGEARPQFMPLIIAAPGNLEVPCVPSVSEPPASPARVLMADITLVNGRRLSVAATIDPMVLVHLVQALDPS